MNLRKSPGCISLFASAVIGAVAENLAANPTEHAKAWAYELIFHGQRFFEEGKALRRAAISEGSEAKHREANAAFERSFEAGVPEALAQLGIAHCIGLGVPRDWRRGHAMLVELVKQDGRLGAIYLGDPDVCPASQEAKPLPSCSGTRLFVKSGEPAH